MARAKKTAVVVTLKREVLANGNIRLSSPKGIIDSRTDSVYSEVICKPRYERLFYEAETQTEI